MSNFPSRPTKAQILVLNRRDPANPRAGGAEHYTREIFGRLSRDFDISHFSSAFPGSSAKESADGVTYFRRGNELTTHIHGRHFAAGGRKRYEIIVDQFNGIGFGTQRLQQSAVLVHQLYDEFWTLRFGVPGYLCKAIERRLLRRYIGRPVITVSESTRRDLVRLGFPGQDIRIVMNGLNHISYPPKEGFDPVVLFLGRMVRTKRPEHAVRAFLYAKKKLPFLKLYMVGEGDQRAELERRYREWPDILFFGFVTEDRKYELLRTASALLVPSIREGWGQVVLQANMTGTPVIGCDVAGIRDSIRDGHNGILVARDDHEDMGRRIVELFEDKDLLRRLSGNASEYSRDFSWEESSTRMRDVVNQLIDNKINMSKVRV